MKQLCQQFLIPAVPKAKHSRILEIGLPHKGSGYGTIKRKK